MDVNKKLLLKKPPKILQNKMDWRAFCFFFEGGVKKTIEYAVWLGLWFIFIMLSTPLFLVQFDIMDMVLIWVKLPKIQVDF